MWIDPACNSKVGPFISCLMEHYLSHSSLLHDFSVHFCPHLFFDLHTESCGHFILAESINASEPQRNLARRHAVWPLGRTKPSNISNIATAGLKRSLHVSPSTMRRRSTSSPVLGDELRGEMVRTAIQYRETCCAICQNGWVISQKISWTKECPHQGTHPQALLVNQFRKLHELWYRGQYLHSLRERPKLRSTQEDQDHEGSLQETHW